MSILTPRWTPTHYAALIINGERQTKQKIPVDKDCGSNPEWKYTMKFTAEEAAANQKQLNLVICLVSDRLFSDIVIWEVLVPIKEFLDCEEKVFVCDVRLLNGKVKGTLKLCCKIGEKFNVPVPAPPHETEKAKSAKTAMMGYRAARTARETYLSFSLRTPTIPSHRVRTNSRHRHMVHTNSHRVRTHSRYRHMVCTNSHRVRTNSRHRHRVRTNNQHRRRVHTNGHKVRTNSHRVHTNSRYRRRVRTHCRHHPVPTLWWAWVHAGPTTSGRVRTMVGQLGHDRNGI
ncbi:hypothetical protein SLA2020_213110 [Shorea laevis]